MFENEKKIGKEQESKIKIQKSNLKTEIKYLVFRFNRKFETAQRKFVSWKPGQ